MKEIDSQPESPAAKRAWERLSYLQTQQFRHLRFFSGVALGWIVLQVMLLRLEGNPWLVFPLGLLTTVLSLTAWAIHRKLSFEVLATKDLLQASISGRSGFERNDGFATLESIGFGGTYLVVALFGLYFAILPISHGSLPGWSSPAKPAEQVEAKPIQAPQGLVPAAYAGYPPAGYSPAMTPFPGPYPRPVGNYLPNTLPLKPSAMTPLQRPFATPATARMFPPNQGGPAPSNSIPRPLPPAVATVAAPAAGSAPPVSPSAPKSPPVALPSSPATKVAQPSAPVPSPESTKPPPTATPVPAKANSPRP